jgi:hypothetical protein
MSTNPSEIAKRPTTQLDGFDTFEGGTEGGDTAPATLLQGTRIKFTNEATWITNDGDELPDTLELIAVDIVRATLKWKPDKSLAPDTFVVGPGERFPDVVERNAATPRSEWVEGPDGQMRGPWQNQHTLYLIDADVNKMERFSFRPRPSAARSRSASWPTR